MSPCLHVSHKNHFASPPASFNIMDLPSALDVLRHASEEEIASHQKQLASTLQSLAKRLGEFKQSSKDPGKNVLPTFASTQHYTRSNNRAKRKYKSLRQRFLEVTTTLQKLKGMTLSEITSRAESSQAKTPIERQVLWACRCCSLAMSYTDGQRKESPYTRVDHLINCAMVGQSAKEKGGLAKYAQREDRQPLVIGIKIMVAKGVLERKLQYYSLPVYSDAMVLVIGVLNRYLRSTKYGDIAIEMDHLLEKYFLKPEPSAQNIFEALSEIDSWSATLMSEYTAARQYENSCAESLDTSETLDTSKPSGRSKYLTPPYTEDWNEADISGLTNGELVGSHNAGYGQTQPRVALAPGLEDGSTNHESNLLSQWDAPWVPPTQSFYKDTEKLSYQPSQPTRSPNAFLTPSIDMQLLDFQATAFSQYQFS
ncbi:uncharacterized protein BJX67DRAFT_359507 [Aspergillus lucknowensis]|uniref:Uncharacterized protein n=1 Tax=Aspergillus lucknowensis TaxID=176173 RepID=A0ABR4LK99_9EURO